MCRRVLTRRVRALTFAVVAGLVAHGFACTVQAALLAYDPLQTARGAVITGPYLAGDENAGTNLLGGQNPTIGPDTSFYAGAWVQTGGDASAVKSIPSLSYPSYFHGSRGQVEETTQFSCCTFGRNGRPFGDVFGVGANGMTADGSNHVIYGSFLIDWGTVGTNPPSPVGTNEGKHGFEMWNDTNATSPDSKLVVDLAFNYYTGDPLLYLNVLGTRQNLAGNWTRDALAAINGGTNLVVLKLEFTDINGEDRVSVYLNPTDSNEANWTPAASIGVPTGSLSIWGHSAFSSFQFDGGGNNPGAIDEFRWGETFADVTPFIPEPGSIVLSMIGIVGLLLPRRGR
jgi:hypothetical protein